jgi:thioredoxin
MTARLATSLDVAGIPGSSGGPVSTTTDVPYLNAEQFATMVERTPGLALVDFTADWCPPCRALSPHIDALARELGAGIVVAKVDVDNHPQLAARFGVQSIPAVIFFQDGRAVDRIIGAVPTERLRERVEALR